tara:strand:+ start:211 stop:411 length:201 start_codon:yes stop_codon:yes gene_type:complete
MTTKYYGDITEGHKETVIQMYKDAKVEPETYTEYPSPPTLRSMTGLGESLGANFVDVRMYNVTELE